MAPQPQKKMGIAPLEKGPPSLLVVARPAKRTGRTGKLRWRRMLPVRLARKKNAEPTWRMIRQRVV